MKKRAYRAVNVNRIDEEELRIAVGGRRLIVGLDVAKKTQFACLATEEGKTLATMKWSHPDETDEAVQRLRGAGASAVEIVMEPSGTYGDPLRYQFERAGFGVWFVGGKRTHDAKEVFDGVPSLHDAKSGHILVRLHLQGLSNRWKPMTAQERDLAAAVETEARRNGRFSENLCRLEARCAAHWPELCHLMKLGRATVLALLEQYPGPALVAANMETARELMKRVGGRLLGHEKIEEVLKSAQHTTGVPMTAGECDALRELAKDVESDRKAAQEARHHLEQLGARFADAALLGEVCGLKTAAVLRSELGEVAEYSSAQSYQKAMGLNLRENSSGQRKQGGLHVTKRGPSQVRKVMFLFALRMLKDDPVVRAWYLKKVARDGGRVRLKAVVAVMRKLALALWHVGQGAKFDNSKMFDVSRLQLPRDFAQNELALAEAVVLEREVAMLV